MVVLCSASESASLLRTAPKPASNFGRFSEFTEYNVFDMQYMTQAFICLMQLILQHMSPNTLVDLRQISDLQSSFTMCIPQELLPYPSHNHMLSASYTCQYCIAFQVTVLISICSWCCNAVTCLGVLDRQLLPPASIREAEYSIVRLHAPPILSLTATTHLLLCFPLAPFYLLDATGYISCNGGAASIPSSRAASPIP